MTTKEILIKAKGLIEQPENWKQGGLATMENEEAVAPFCSLGAVGKTLEIFAVSYGSGSRTGDSNFGIAGKKERNHGDPEMIAKYEAATKILKDCMGEEVWKYNDSHDHQCVMQLFDAAIEREEAK